MKLIFTKMREYEEVTSFFILQYYNKKQKTLYCKPLDISFQKPLAYSFPTSFQSSITNKLRKLNLR